MCSIFSEKLTNKELIERGLDKELVGKKLLFVSNLIKEGEVGNFSNIDKYLKWDEFRKGKHK